MFFLSSFLFHTLNKLNSCNEPCNSSTAETNIEGRHAVTVAEMESQDQNVLQSN